MTNLYAMPADEIVQRIMTQHWDISACLCWVCEAGRALGIGATRDYLRHGLYYLPLESVSVAWPDEGTEQ